MKVEIDNATPGRLDLYSPYSPEECLSRLSGAIDLWSPVPFSGYFGSRPVTGKINGLTFRLRKRIGYRNSFQSFFTGLLRPHENGTVIQGIFGMHAFVRVFMMIWFGVVILIGGIFWLTCLICLLAGAHEKALWLGLIVPPLMPAMGFGAVRLGQYAARDEARFLTKFIRETLQAEDRHSPSAPPEL